jgi:hypothetical protein
MQAAHYDELFRQNIRKYRAGELSFDEFAEFCEETIDKYRARADYILSTHTELYMSFAARAAKRSVEAIEAMDTGFELVIAYLNGGEDSLLDEALPYLTESIEGFKASLELNEECMELDGGVAGTI